MARLHRIENYFSDINIEIDAVRALESQWNALSPISKLPPEILTSIFLFYKESYREASDMRDCSLAEKDATAWQSVSHVCQHWRAVALNCTTLWSIINLQIASRSDCLSEFLLRSKNAPLTITEAELLKDEQSVSKLLSRLESAQIGRAHV